MGAGAPPPPLVSLVSDSTVVMEAEKFLFLMLEGFMISCKAANFLGFPVGSPLSRSPNGSANGPESPPSLNTTELPTRSLNDLWPFVGTIGRALLAPTAVRSVTDLARSGLKRIRSVKADERSPLAARSDPATDSGARVVLRAHLNLFLGRDLNSLDG